MTPIRRGDGTGLDVKNYSEVRKGDGTVLWTSILGSKVGQIDDFEDNSLSEYSGDTGQFVIQTNTVNEGTYALAGGEGGSGTPVYATDSYIYVLEPSNSPGRGYETQWDFGFFGEFYTGSAAGSAQALLFCLQDTNNYYYAGSHNDNENHIYKIKNGAITKSDTAAQDFGQDTWYGAKLQIGSSTISYEAGGTTVTISDTEWDGGGYGFAVGDVRDSSTDFGSEFDDLRNSSEMSGGGGATTLTLVGQTTNADLASPHAAIVAPSGDYVFTAGKGGSVASVDVTDPSTPTAVSALTVYDNAQMVMMDPNDSSVLYASHNGELLTIDVTDPTSISETNAYSVTNLTRGNGGYISGDSLYIADKDGYLFEFDISTPSTPSTTQDVSVAYAAHDIAAGNGAVFGVDQKTGASTHLYSHDINDMSTQLDSYGDATNLEGANRVQFYNDYVYVACNYADTIAVFDASDTSNLSEVGIYDTRSPEPSGMELYEANNRLLVGTDQHLQVFDITDPTNLTEIAYYDFGSSEGIHDPCLPFDNASRVAWPGQATDTLHITDL